MNRVAFDMVCALHGGGFKTYNNNIIKRLLNLKKSNFKFYIYTNDSKLFKKNNIYNIEIIKVPKIFSIGSFRIIWTQFFFPFFLFFKKIDILFAPMNMLPALSKLIKIKKVLVIHSNLPWLHPEDLPGSFVKKIIQKLLINNSVKIADKIIVDSQNAKKELVQIFDKIEKKISTVYLGVDFKKQNSYSYSINSILNECSSPYLLTISSSVKYHCIIELIEAYEMLNNHSKNAPNYIILSKKLDKNYFNLIKSKVNKSKYKNKIKLIEDLTKDEISYLYSKAKLYIFSSYCEVFGLTNLEAMYYGIPVITSNSSSLPEICGDAAIYTDPFDPSEIEEKISMLLNDNKLCNDMIAKGKERVKRFSWNRTFSETLSIINKVSIEK